MNQKTRWLAALTVLAMIPAGAAVGTDGVSCGATVTADLTLTHDLVGCPADGLVAGASGITIDLGGHTIEAAAFSAGAGVRVGPGREGVTVRNGTIVGFSQGVVLDTARDNEVTRLHVADSTRGIDLANAAGNTIHRNTVTESELDGIRVDGAGSDGNVVARNEVTANGFIGITVSNHADDNVIDRNVVSAATFGIAVFAQAERVVVSRNDVRGAAIAAIQVDAGSDGGFVHRNDVSDSGVGILVKAGVSHTTVVKNVVTGNAGDGIAIGADDGFVDRNKVTANGGWGVHLLGTSDGNLVTRDQLRGNALGAVLDEGDNTVRGERRH